MPGGERIKLLDFGIAKIIADGGGVRTQANVIMGTPAYMSPEQCLGAKDVDAKTDVYALGIILFEMLAARPPFVAERPGEFLAMHMLRPPPLLTQFVPLIPSKLVGLVHSMLAKEPAARPSMEQVAAQLQRLVVGNQAGLDLLPIPPAPPSATEDRPTRPAKALAKGRVSAEISGSDLPVTTALRVKKLGTAGDGKSTGGQKGVDDGAYDPTSPGAPDFGDQLDVILDNARTIPVQSMHLADLQKVSLAAAAPAAPPLVTTGPSWVPMEIVKSDYTSAPEEPEKKSGSVSRSSQDAQRLIQTGQLQAPRRTMLWLVLVATLVLAALTALLFLRGSW